ncbi:asparaginase [Hamadaea tsunoensis]|uniref:asparaginase n=1 Tax=Hamadaea tsunoensis TaxID=53368 RepID=UPI0003F9A99E|nr:asparaginase [Hamadaea tsunoensis]
MQPRTPVAVFSLGGTISMSSLAGGEVVPSLGPAELVSAIPGLDRLPVALTLDAFRLLPAGTLAFANVLDLAAAIEAAFHAGKQGVVVTQGTNTIEETAFLLDLLHDRPEPVVVTGAMRNPTMAGHDGPANLLAAIQTAASPDSRDRGVLVAFNDEVHAARWVRKTHTTNPAAFSSPETGPVGVVVESRVRFTGGPSARLRAPRPTRTDVKVGLATATLGDEGDWLPAYADRLDGLVVAGFGCGHVHGAWPPILERIGERIPVVFTSRIGVGPVLANTYGFDGSEADLIRRRLVGAGRLDPFKARILLWTLLAAGADHDAIRAAYAEA